MFNDRSRRGAAIQCVNRRTCRRKYELAPGTHLQRAINCNSHVHPLSDAAAALAKVIGVTPIGVRRAQLCLAQAAIRRELAWWRRRRDRALGEWRRLLEVEARS